MTCQAHPALVKIGLVLARLFIFNSLLVCLHLVKVLCTACLLRSVSCRDSEVWQLYGDPAPSGMRQYTVVSGTAGTIVRAGGGGREF